MKKWYCISVLIFFAMQSIAQKFNESDLTKKLNKISQKEQLKLFDSLSITYNVQNNDEGLAQLSFMLRFAKKNNFPPTEQADLYYSRGSIYRKLKKYPNALDDFKQAEAIYLKHKNKAGLSSVYTAYSNLYTSIGDNIKAIKYLHKALQITDVKKNSDGIGVVYNSLANVYLSLKSYDSSLYYYNKSYQIYDSKDASYQKSLLLDNISMTHLNNESLDSAYIYSKRAREEAKKVNDTYLDLQLMLNAGAVEEKLEHHEMTLKIAIEAKKIADSLQVPIYQLYTQANYANALFKTGQAAKSVVEYRKVIPVAKEFGINVLLKDLYKGYSEAFEKVNQRDSAFYYYKLMVAIGDTIEKEAAADKVTELIARNQLEKKENRLKHEQELRKAEQEAHLAEKSKLEQRGKMQWWIIGLSVLAIFITIALLIIINKRLSENRRLSGLLKEKNTEILDKNKSLYDSKKEIISSINYAKRIQYALLAHDEFLRTNLPDHFVVFKPKDIVSGDFFWATEKAATRSSKKEFYLAVCDCTGHGVPGAFMSLLNISFLNEAINEKNISEPHLVLNHVRLRLIKNMEGSRDGMDATVVRFMGEKLQYAAAHNRLVLIRNDELIELPADKMPVGMNERMDSFTLHEVDLKKGDVLFFFTDGFADQFGGPKKKKFKNSNLHQLLLQLSAKTSPEIKTGLEEAFTDWKGDFDQIDDVCIVGVRI